MLPHLEGRPVTMVRLPDGVEGERFFEKRCPGHRPGWLETVPLDADSDIQACCIDDLPGLLWTANLAAHTRPGRAAMQQAWVAEAASGGTDTDRTATTQD